MGETEGDYIDRRLAVIPKLQQRIVDQENEIKRLNAELDKLTKPPLRSNHMSIDVDNPLYEGLVLRGVDPAILEATIHQLKKERDEARMLARKFHHGAFANFDKSKYSWLEDTDG